MQAVTLSFKDSKRVVNGMLWSWRPEYGEMAYLDEKDGQVYNISLSALSSGVLHPNRIRDNHPQNLDLLEKARAEGFAE